MVIRHLLRETDGVGTKLKLAFVMDKHDTIGIDCVAMCVNDVVCLGAKPLIFLDYIATGKLAPKHIEQIVSGVSKGCQLAGCALIGGETAEMPGFYQDGEYDIAGFSVGNVKISEIIDSKKVKQGDVLIGLASSGVHSNGYSLVRKLVDMTKEGLEKNIPGTEIKIGEALLAPTKIYVKTILALKEKYDISGVAHITGGGFIENIPRAVPKELGIKINVGSWPIPEIIKYLVEKAGIDEESAFNTFNMGIGMVVIVDKDISQNVLEDAKAMGEDAYVIGEITGERGIEFVK